MHMLHARLNSTLFLFFFLSAISQAQTLSGVYKVEQLFSRIENKDTLYVLNFWATWCKPCMEELRSIDSVGQEFKMSKTKLLFVNLDFSDKTAQVNQVLKQKQILSECVLLDEVNGNAYIDRISEKWSGEIPATVLIKAGNKTLISKKLSAAQLRAAIEKTQTQ